MTYQEAITYLEHLSRFGVQLGLSRISKLLDLLGNPEKTLRFIHIAGTNGKGSTATMLSHALTKSGYQTGLFISPYVLCFRERMQINGVMISEDDFALCATEVCRCADELALQMASPTQFELETAIAFLWYLRKGCDIVCLEVGLGGRFDSTNVIPPPLLQVITSIGLDHTAVLGDSLEKIAFEKAGIIKGGETVIYPLQDSKALSVLKTACKRTGSHFVIPDLDALELHNEDLLQGEFSYQGQRYRKSLAGQVQFYNCITVIEATKALSNQGFFIDKESLRFGIEHSQFPARMECLSQTPFVILDGAHNPDGARSLAGALRALAPRPITLMMGVLDDKDYKAILTLLLPYVHRFIALTPPNPRALSARNLANQAQYLCNKVSFFEDLDVAIQETLDVLRPEGALVVCGSLYLASALRPLLLNHLNHSKQEDQKRGDCHERFT